VILKQAADKILANLVDLRGKDGERLTLTAILLAADQPEEDEP
jgi:hypothetical protein